MLAIISDLHLTDASTATNVDKSAFALLSSEIITSADVHRATELHLVLLGDIFDLVRTDYWHCCYGDDPASRPWGGTADPQTGMNTSPQVEQDFIAILGRVLATDSSQALLAMIASLAAWCNSRAIPFNVTYVIGNHDRMLYNYPFLKQIIVQAMPVAANFTANNFSDKVNEPAYGLLARHGWEWDLDCYGLSYYNKKLSPGTKKVIFDPAINNVIAYGEVVTTEVMAGLIFYARENLGLNVDPSRQNQQDIILLNQLRELNNLRPLDEVVNWFPWILENFPPEKKDLVLNALQSALKNALNCRLAKDWPDDGGVLSSMSTLNAYYFGNIFQKAGLVLKVIGGKIAGVFSHAQEPLIKGAQSDFAEAARGYYYVVYGHTHLSQQNCFTAHLQGNSELYVNTGTFLPVIEGTTDASGNSTKSYSTSYAMTLAFFYKADEDMSGKNPGDTRPTMEYWDGRRRKTYIPAEVKKCP